MEPPSLAQRYRAEGYVVVPGLITGDDLRALERLVDLTLDGKLKPVHAYKGWLPPEFYTHWEPGYEELAGLPRRDRVRSMANMYHHHPEWRKVGQHPAICEVVASLYQQSSSGVQFLNDAVWMKPSGGLGATLHQDTGFPTIAAASNPNSMNFWLAIDPATELNGCLFVAPGSHRKTLPHDRHPVQGRIMRASAAASLPPLVPVELEPGDGYALSNLRYTYHIHPGILSTASLLETLGFSSTRRSRTCPHRTAAKGVGEHTPAFTALGR